MNVSENIVEFLKYKGISVNKFSSEIGVSNSYFSKQLKENGSIGSKIIQEIVKKYEDINPEWLLTGNGEMLKDPREPVVIPKSFIKPEVPIKEIPLLPLDAVAGMGSGEFTVMEGDILQYYKVVEFKSADFMIPVKGSSMQPKYYGGDLLACRFIKTFSYFQWGVPHVITIKDKGTLVKRVFQCKEDHEIELRSDNDNYPPFCIPKEDIVNISIVVGVIRLE